MHDVIFPKEWHHTFQWEGLRVAYVQTPCPKIDEASSTIVLIHGFGACKEHWRYTLPALSQHHSVIAIDLIGFGASDQPPSKLRDEAGDGGWCYGIDSWAAQVMGLLDHAVKGPVQLVGNSIGGVVALATAKLLEEKGRPAQQVILIDCAQRNLDDKRLNEQPPLRRIGRPLLKSLVRQRWFTSFLFRSLIKPSIIRRILLQAYPTGQNVNEELITILITPAKQLGAAESFRGFINLFNDRLAPELLAVISTPVALLWGEKDPWEPIKEAETWQRFPCVQSFQQLPGLGHCPHDENPEMVNSYLLPLTLKAQQASC